MANLKLDLTLLALSFIFLSACGLQTTNETQIPGQLNNLSTPTGAQATVTGGPTETDQQLLDKLTGDTDPNVDQEFQKLNSQLQ